MAGARSWPIRNPQIVISALDRLERQGLVNVAGFVIMPDHVHAFFWFDDDSSLPGVMQSWKRTSAHYLRKFYERHSPEMIDFLSRREGAKAVVSFWQKRYYDFNVFNPETFNEKLDYIHFNPVRKSLAARPEDYAWSSAPWYNSGRSVGVRIKPGY